MTDNLSNKVNGSIVVNKIDSLDETDLVPASMSYTHAKVMLLYLQKEV